MRSSRQGAIPSDLGWLVDELDGLSERMRTLETPSGESLGSTVAKLTALVSNIQAQLDEYNATRYTNAQIDARILSLIASHMAGNVAIGGELTVQGAVTMPNVYTTDIVALGGGRTAVWVRDGGRIGHT